MKYMKPYIEGWVVDPYDSDTSMNILITSNGQTYLFSHHPDAKPGDMVRVSTETWEVLEIAKRPVRVKK